MPTVAIASEFLDAFARIPRAQQRKVREFTEKFRSNPKGPGINYEKIHAVKDDKVRTVRIDQKYRAVILHPPEGDVYVLVWVDNHDEAMDWAGKRKFEVNPVTGSLQVFSVSEAEEAVAPQKKTREPGLLDAYDDDVLLSFGVPHALLPSVRAVKTQDALLALVKHLPAEAAEALTWLGEGNPVEEVRAAVTVTPAKETVNPEDLGTALENLDTKRRFVTIKSQDDLTSILNAPLAKWRIFLHPSQERLVGKKFNGPARVLGGPGTGKTVVAMHRARHLAREVFKEKTDRILFTTKTVNLAESIEGNLRSLCGDEGERIEVINLDAWAVRFMQTQRVDFQVASDEEIDQCWGGALNVAGDPDFDIGFLKQEWALVVQTNGITTMPEYLQVPRTGRGGAGGAEVRHSRGGGSLLRRDGQGTAQAQAARGHLRGRPDEQTGGRALPAAAQGGQGAERRAGEEERPGLARRAAWDDAPGQGAGVSRHAPGRGQFRSDAAAGGLSRRRPHGQGRTRGAGAVAAIRGGDPGQGPSGRHGPRQSEPIPGETVRRHLTRT